MQVNVEVKCLWMLLEVGDKILKYRKRKIKPLVRTVIWEMQQYKMYVLMIGNLVDGIKQRVIVDKLTHSRYLELGGWKKVNETSPENDL